MKKHYWYFMMCVLTIGSLLTGCAALKQKLMTERVENQIQSDTEDGTREKTEINIFISSPEYADAFQTLIDIYEESHPEIRIHYETTQNDYPTLLKVRMNSGQVPDLFSTTTGKEIDIYKDWSYDLSKEPLVESMEPMVAELMKSQKEGTGIYGLALKDNFFGLIYNNKILDEAGITDYPETLSQLEEMCERLEHLGYQPFTTGYKEWWVYKHIFQHFLAAAAESSGVDVSALVEKLEKGEVRVSDYPELSQNLYDFLDLTVRYGGENARNLTLNGQVEEFASGKAVIMVGQGAWVESDLMNQDDTLSLGFYGYPVSEDPEQCNIIAGADQAIRVYKDSKVLEEVLEFVNWWYTSDYGVEWFTDVAEVAAPVKTQKESSYQIVRQGNSLVEQRGSAELGICYSTDQLYEQMGRILSGYINGGGTRQVVSEEILRLWPEIDGNIDCQK